MSAMKELLLSELEKVQAEIPGTTTEEAMEIAIFRVQERIAEQSDNLRERAKYENL